MQGFFAVDPGDDLVVARSVIQVEVYNLTSDCSLIHLMIHLSNSNL